MPTPLPKNVILLLDEATNELHVRATYGYEDIGYAILLIDRESYVGRAIEERKPPLLIMCAAIKQSLCWRGKETGNINRN